jgi:hypothetical protein
MSKDRLTLFLVFVYQSDQQGIELGDMWQHHPSHVVRRWFLDSAPFLPLAARDEVRHALSRYDGAAWWPTEDMPFSRYFATDAFDRGWRLESETEMICDAVSALRREVGLPEHSGWPMCSFTSTVRNLLTNAWFQQSFERFTHLTSVLRLCMSGTCEPSSFACARRCPTRQSPSLRRYRIRQTR